MTGGVCVLEGPAEVNMTQPKYPKMLYVVEEGAAEDKFLAAYRSLAEAMQDNLVNDPQKIAVYGLVKIETKTLVIQ